MNNNSDLKSETNKILELFSNTKELTNLIPNIVKKNYNEFSKILENKIIDFSNNTPKYINDKKIRELASNTIEDKTTLFNILTSQINSLKFKPSNHPPIIDLTNYGYLSYNNPSGMIDYAKSINHNNYTIDENADTLFKKLLDDRHFEGDYDIYGLYSGTAILESCWSNEINKRNNSNNKITFIDSSSMAIFMQQVLLGNEVKSQKQHMNSYNTHDFFYNTFTKGKNPLVIKHNGMCSSNTDYNYEELLLFRSATKHKNTKVFFTIPTLCCDTRENAYLTNNSKEIPFAYSTLTNLLSINEENLKKFEPVVLTQRLNMQNSIVYKIGFKTNTNIEINNPDNSYSIILPKETILLVQRSNRYSAWNIDEFEYSILGRSSDKSYEAKGNFSEGIVALT